MVPNKFPSYASSLRVAIIGEAPGRDEETFGAPFVGASGRFLAALLSRAGINKDACYLGNISQHRPSNNDIATLSWSGDEIQTGLYQLGIDIKEFKPNIVVLLGNTALKAAKDPLTNHILKPNQFKCRTSQWRGSLFIGEKGGPFEGLKCMATYHPAYALRDYEVTPLLQFDLRKAVREAATPTLSLPRRNLQVVLSKQELIFNLQSLRRLRKPVAIDIEGGIDTMSCISFADSPENAFIVAFDNATPEVWRETALTLEDPYVPKILQNALYDRFVLHYSYGIRVQGVVHDTMLKHWELYPELEKSLGVQASIYTDEPYYKFERKADDNDTFYKYCCKDSAVTLEISDKLEQLVHGSSLEHYRLNVNLLNPILYMELRGIKYDIAGAASRRQALLDKLHEAQAQLNGMTGHGFSWQKGLGEIRQRIIQTMWRKDGKAPLKPYVESVQRTEALLKQPNPNLAVLGEIEDLCEVSLNVDSAKQFQHYLYEILKLPVQMSDIRGQEPHVTSDYEALLKLSRWCTQNKHTGGFDVCQKAIEIRALGTRAQMLSISADRDGRIRCGYNLVGSNTGRITCYESPTGSGYNLQTIPNYTSVKEAPGGVLGDRDLFLADEDHWLFQCDLSGADGWTVAAYSAMLGDSTMLLDYKAGIKPYARIALKIEGKPEADWTDLPALSAFLKTFKLGPIPKLTAKRVQHGGAYLEGGLTISRNILKDSEGKVYFPPAECDKLKNWYIKEKYWGVPKWHDWIARRLKERPILVAASGQVRQFFGRPDEILTKAVAFEPQANTTYATNLAAWRLWSDNENRYQSTQQRTCLKIEPLHQVHDALLGQFKKEDTDWAITKIHEWFNNVLIIAGQQITIPFEGNYGTSWGNLDKSKI